MEKIKSLFVIIFPVICLIICTWIVETEKLTAEEIAIIKNHAVIYGFLSVVQLLIIIALILVI